MQTELKVDYTQRLYCAIGRISYLDMESLANDHDRWWNDFKW